MNYADLREFGKLQSDITNISTEIIQRLEIVDRVNGRYTRMYQMNPEYYLEESIVDYVNDIVRVYYSDNRDVELFIDVPFAVYTRDSAINDFIEKLRS